MLRKTAPLAVAVLALACSLEDLSNGTRPPDAAAGGSGGQGGAGGSPTTTTTSGGGGGGAGPSGPCVPGPSGSKFAWLCGFGNATDQGTLQSDDIAALRLATWNDGVVLAVRVKGALDFGGGPLGDMSTDRDNVLVAAFSADGQLAADRSFSIGGSASVKTLGDVAVSPTGRIAVVGSFQSGTLIAGPATLNAPANAADGFVIVFETDGSSQVRHLRGGMGEEGRSQGALSVVFDGEGLLVGGEYVGSLAVADAASTTDMDCGLTGDTSSNDAFVLKFSDTLDCVAGFAMGGTGSNMHDGTLTLAVGPGSQVVAGGVFKGTMTVGALPNPLPSTSNSEDGFIVQLDPALEPVWAKRFGDHGSDRTRQLAVIDGAVYLTGVHAYNLELAGCTSMYVNSGRNPLVARLGLADGTCTWFQTFKDTGTGEGRSLALTPAGITVAGFFQNQIPLGGMAPQPSEGYQDAFVALLEEAQGDVQRGVGMGSIGEDSAEAIAVSADGSAAYVAGTYAGPFDALPQVNKAEDFFLARLPLTF